MEKINIESISLKLSSIQDRIERLENRDGIVTKKIEVKDFPSQRQEDRIYALDKRQKNIINLIYQFAHKNTDKKFRQIDLKFYLKKNYNQEVSEATLFRELKKLKELNFVWYDDEHKKKGKILELSDEFINLR